MPLMRLCASTFAMTGGPSSALRDRLRTLEREAAAERRALTLAESVSAKVVKLPTPKEKRSPESLDGAGEDPGQHEEPLLDQRQTCLARPVPREVSREGIVRASHETCIVAKRGRPLIKARNVRSVFEAPVGRHSEKPEGFYDLVESLADGPYLELFARRVRPGWTCLGNELPRER
jgi:hypothetical protein